MSDYAIEMKNITKRFGTLIANDNVTLQVKKSEIHAILGENGAGKSTLMSILFGLYGADSGEVLINGQFVDIKSPNDANDLRIGMVHQHFKQVDVFTVLDNIILGKETIKRGFLDKEESRIKILELCEKYHLHIDLDAYVKDITVGMQQRVEILKMLYRDADILIFDEPTAVLTPQEITGLMEAIKGFAVEGKSIILITHKLNEIQFAADRCTILRKGKYIGTYDVKDTSNERLAELMVGREVNFTVEKTLAQPKDVILEVKNLNLMNKDRTKKVINDLSMRIRSGEIVTIAGIDGNGQTELVQLLSGLMPVVDGEIILNNKHIEKMSIRDRFELGLAHIPEDRQRHGLILRYTIAENMISNEYYKRKFQRRGLLRFNEIAKYTDNLIEKYDIRSSMGRKSLAGDLSGGNQQKAIIARETSRDHNFLIASQPTRGLDVGAIEFVHKTLVQERDKGNGILVVSFELDEVLELSDRILVMYEGSIVAELDPKLTDENEIGLYMSGAKRQEVID
jgi:simple sugar transport system ATP-binding protein